MAVLVAIGKLGQVVAKCMRGCSERILGGRQCASQEAEALEKRKCNMLGIAKEAMIFL